VHRSPSIYPAVDARYTALAGTCDTLSCGDVVPWAAPGIGEVVVDLGCGRGRDVLRAAVLVGPRGEAIGIDRNEAMLSAARGLVPPGVSNVRFLAADLAALPLPDGHADVVVSSCAINHAPDKAAVFLEIARVLRPGGRFAVADVVSDDELPRHVRDDPTAWAACYGGAIPEARYLEIIHAARLSDVEVVRRTHPYTKGSVLVRSITVRGCRPD
jgi:arsenite methyltransferase